jgi:DNA polymerase III epsilon subunit-like protein
MANLLFIDVESSGLGSNAALLEIALIPYIDGEIKPHFQSYIKPHEGATLDPKAFEVNRINVNDIWSFPDANEVIKRILEFIDSHQCVFALSAHNLPFDRKMLNTFFNRHGHYTSFYNRFKPGGVDTLAMAKKVFKGKRKKPDGFSLEKLCKFYEIELVNSHSALPDIQATIEVYEKLLSNLTVIQTQSTPILPYQEMKRKYIDARYVQFNPDGDIWLSAEATQNETIRRFIFTHIDELYGDVGYEKVLEVQEE